MEILTKCLQDVSSWMSSRKLKLNPDKTGFLLIGSKVQHEIFSRLLAQEVTPSPSARNLGIVFDSALNFKSHISGISRAWYYHIRDMRFLTPSVSKTIATSLIGSKLDYCNSIVLFNTTEKEISKLQGVQNCLARVVTKSPSFWHITPLLKSLHWFPDLPGSDQWTTSIYSKHASAIAKGTDHLNVPRVRTAVGSRASSVAAPGLWN